MQRPAFLDLRRLEGRIVALFLGLLLLVQLGSVVLVNRSVQANAEASIDASLKTAGHRLERLLFQRVLRQHDVAVLLAADDGFRSAVGLMHQEAGPETLRDALANHAERVGAEVVAFEDLEHRLVAGTGEQPERFVRLATDLPEGAPTEGDTRLVLVDDKPYQLVRVPVRAPGPLGAVLMGFALDEDVLADLKGLTNVDALLLVRGAGPWRRPLSLEPDKAGMLMEQAAQAEMGQNQARRLNLPDGDERRGRLFDLRAQGAVAQAQLSALLTASVSEAIGPYNSLRWTLLALTLAGVVAFAIGSVVTARRISGPIGALARSAERLGRGDYDCPVRAPRNLGEVSELAQAFETMRQGIKAREADVHRLAFWDPLTDLPNRAQFVERLRKRLHERPQEPMAVLMLDLDRFKHVNDVLGHAVGDQLLQRVAERLQALAGASHLLARLGGDEFALLFEGADASQALGLAREMAQGFEQPLSIGEQTIDVSAGIGVALFPAQAAEADALLSHAELAMYAAKRGQHGVLLYDPAMDEGSSQSLGLLTELRRAVEQDELRLFLQPKLDLHTREVHSAEALVRWQHPTRGLVPPGLFIPFAEQTGFVRQLTAWVLRASARFAVEAEALGCPLRISVNLSTRDLLDAELPDKIRSMLQQEGARPEQLCLEITESAIMDDPARALATTEQLHAMGFRLAIDDFGTGYSSLAYLKNLPVQELKIDQSFVMAMEREADDRKIVRSTIDLAHNLGLAVVAEGIETATALALLAHWGCDEAQGYHLARPMPAGQLPGWWQAWQAPEFRESALGPLTTI